MDLKYNANDIAIIGINLRFPNINTEEEFWDALKNGKDNLEAAVNGKNKIKVNTSLDKASFFDREFFGYTKKEAELMDPQHRLFLQCAWETLEKAGYDSFNYDGLIGLFAGVSTSTYLLNNLMTNKSVMDSVDSLQLSVLNEKDHFVGKTAYKLNLKGPCIAVQTVCSTSLVAVHLACQSLLNGECDMALAGGVTVQYPQNNEYTFYQGGLVSADGRIHAFDQNATGTVYSDGLGIILLKRLEDAIECGDNIRAVIKGSAISSDGSDRVGYTAPGVNGQVSAIIEAQMVAGIPAETIGMIEAHGSGTPLGDSIEIDALIQAFGSRTDDKSFCALGSVKTNIGHTQNASGIAGIIKAVLSLEHKQIPASLNCLCPNEKLEIDKTPFFVNSFLMDWIEDKHPRRAGVSSFGLGGINSHIILEEAPEYVNGELHVSDDTGEVYCLSAKTESVLISMIRNHIAYINSHDSLELIDMALTLKTGRKSFEKRVAIRFDSKQSLLTGLEDALRRINTHGAIAPRKLNCGFDEISCISLDYLVRETEKNALLSGIVTDLFKEKSISIKNLNSVSDDQKNILAQLITARYLSSMFENIEQAEDGDFKIGYSVGDEPGFRTIEEMLSRIWEYGYDVNWQNVYKDTMFHHVDLPTYPFEVEEYFIEPSDYTGNGFDNTEIVRESEITVGSIKNTLRRIWSEKLGVEKIEDDDNFFQLGGHSLLVTQVVLSINSLYNIDFPLAGFYETPFLNGLSKEVYSVICQNSKKYDDLPGVIENTADRYEPFPLTDIQRAYWIGRNGSMDLGNTSTHMYFEGDIQGLDIDRFNSALNKMIERHEMLRAVITTDGKQRILESVPYYTVSFEDISQKNESKQKMRIDEIRQEMSHQIIDCYNWPLFCMKATKVSESMTRLHISFDLLIADAWSMELLLAELSYSYHHPEIELQPLHLSFRDYVNAINEIEKTNRYEKSKEYWRERVKTLPSAPLLPLKTDPSSVTDPHFVRRREFLDKDEWSRIKEKCRKYGISETVMLLSAFSEVLALWSRERAFTLNLTVFNRLPIHEQVNSIIGDFTALNLLEIRNDADTTLLNRMKSNQKQLLNDMDHRYYNGIRVTRDLMKEYSDSNRAIMPIVFTSILNQNSSSWDEDKDFADNLKESDETYSISQTPQVWLDHQVMERNGAIVYNWDTVEELFSENMIEEMFRNYRLLLKRIAETDDILYAVNPLCDERFGFGYKNMVDNDEAHCNSYEVPDDLLYEGFIRQAEKNPDNTAVITSSDIITYSELDRLSNKVASQIEKLKEPKEKLIAVVMKKGWEQIAAVLGILKSGHAYLPIDITQPSERVMDILDLAGVSICVVQERNDNLFGMLSQVVIDNGTLCGLRDEPDSYKAYNITEKADPDDTAYVIFTSGSTGKPKGVVISHRGALNTIIDVNMSFGVTSNDRAIALSSLCFDLSVYDVFGMLSEGAALVIPDYDKTRDPYHWAKMINEHHVTIWNTVPALMKMLVSTDTDEAFNNIRLVLMSGDWIDTSLPAAIWDKNSNIQIISLGGATEASIWSVIYPIQKGKEYRISIPYGKAMTHQTMYILNPAMQQCPIDVIGEIYIGGVGVAKGYWNDDERTREHFVRSPFTGEMLYRTGDIGRYMNDGNIEFLGRQDNQVKINGFRVELGEIEYAIRDNEMVQDAAVVVNDKAAGKQMIAFVQVDKESAYGLSNTGNEEIILDSTERLKFKLKETAVRDLPDRKRVCLDNSLLCDDDYYKHRSYRHFSDEKILLADFTRVIGSLARKKSDTMLFPKYRYASGGGLYPVQAYLYIKADRIEGVPAGLYYYDPKNNDLVLLDGDTVLTESIHEKGNRSIFTESAFSIFLVGKKSTVRKMYGEREGMNYIKIEAGLISSLLENTGIDNQIGFCQIGTLDFESISHKLELDEDSYYIHCLLGGHITQQQMTREGFLKEMSEYDHKKNDNTGKIDVSKLILEKLKDRLPEYMIPSRIVPVSSLPLTSNGKIDRNALLSMLDSTQHIVTEKKANNVKTEAQKKVYSIWSECLGKSGFDIQDNFFDLGGDSVITVQVFGKLKAAFSKPISIVDLFSYPTVEALADFLSQEENACAFEDEERDRANKRKNAIAKKKRRI